MRRGFPAAGGGPRRPRDTRSARDTRNARISPRR